MTSVARERLVWGVVANAGRRSDYRKPRWSHVSDVTGSGNASARALCREAGFDPDEDVGGGGDVPDPRFCGRPDYDGPGYFLKHGGATFEACLLDADHEGPCMGQTRYRETRDDR